MIATTKCWARVHILSLQFSFFVYVDSATHRAEKLLRRTCPATHFWVREYRNFDNDYILVIGKVPKIASTRIKEGLKQLQNEMNSCGFDDYQDFCRKIFSDLRLPQVQRILKSQIRRTNEKTNGGSP